MTATTLKLKTSISEDIDKLPDNILAEVAEYVRKLVSLCSTEGCDNSHSQDITTEIDSFFGGWNCDPRSTDQIMAHIRGARTQNTYPTL